MSASELLVLAATGLLHATALAAITWVVCRGLLRRARPSLQAALWTVVLLKFLLPPVFPGEFALSGWLPGLDFRGGPSPESLSAPLPLDPALPAGEDSASQEALNPLSPAFLLLAAYLLGAAWLGARAAVRGWRLRRRVVHLPAAEGELGGLIRNLARGMNIRRLRTHLSPDACSPFILGLWRPRLVLPGGLIRGLEPGEREALIVHELAHLKRKDHWIRWLQNAARLLFFFWPPVWWVCREIERASELACDQWAVAFSKASPHQYARSLLTVAKAVRPPADAPQLAFTGKARLLEERFEMILKGNPTTPRLSWITTLLLLAWAGFAWAGGAPQQEKKQDAEEGKGQVLFFLNTQEAAGEPETLHLIPREGARVEVKLEALLEKHPEADLNGDGSLDPEELKSHMDWRRQQAREQILLDHPEADINNDGSLSSQEARVFRMEQQVIKAKELLRRDPEADVSFTNTWRMRFSEGDFAALLTPLKRDKKGKLKALFERHPEADTDGDGRLSDEEAKSLAARLKKDN